MFRSCQIIIRELCSLLSYVTVFTIQFVFANEVLWQHIMLCRNVLWSSGSVCFVKVFYVKFYVHSLADKLK